MRSATSERMRLRPALAGALALFLAACAGDEDAALEAAAQPCPPVMVLDAARSAPYFAAGPGRDLVDIRYWISLEDLESSCSYREGLLAGVIDVSGSVVVKAASGPAAGPQAPFEIFVALSDRGRNLLRKDRFAGTVPLSEGTVAASLRQPFRTSIALLPEQSGLHYTVYVGLQLSPAQLVHERTRERN